MRSGIEKRRGAAGTKNRLDSSLIVQLPVRLLVLLFLPQSGQHYGCVMICLFPNCAYISDTSRMIEIYRAVRKRGLDPIVASHGGQYEFLLRQEQVPHIRLKPFSNERAEKFISINRMEDLFGEFYEAAELRDHVGYEIEFFKSRNVRFVHGGFTLSNSISARAVGARYSVAHSMVPLIFERKMQPWPDELDWWVARLIPEPIKRNFINRTMLHSKRFAGPFNRVARDYGIAPFKRFLEVMLGDLTYVTDTPEILGINPEDFGSWKPNPSLYSRQMAFKLVGAIFARFSGDIPDSIREFVATKDRKIYVALTSTKREYVDAVYQGLKNRRARVIFATNIHPDVVTNSESIRVFDYLPSHKVMPLVDLAIIHGGQGSVQTAIASGIPVIGFPLQPEQKFNLQLLENRGAGICMSLNELLKGCLPTAMDQILGNSAFRDSAMRLKAAQEPYDGAEAIADDLFRVSTGVSSHS